MDDTIEIVYEIGNQICTVRGGTKFHYRLQNDLTFSNKYFSNLNQTKRKHSEITEISNDRGGCQGFPTNINNPTAKGTCKSQGNEETSASSCDPISHPISNNDNNENFKWTRQATLLLLNNYKERINLFRNSKRKNEDIWSEILIDFQNQGYIGVTICILDRQMRNLKKTYKDNRNKKNKTGESCIIWEYYELMDDIFFNDRTINPTSAISSMDPVPENFEASFNLESTDEVASSVSTKTEISQNQKIKVEEKKEEESSKSNKAKRIKHLYDHRKKIQEIEKQRIEEVKKLREALEEHNKIQKERNEIMRQLLRN